MQGLAPSIVGTLPIGPVELFGRVGVMFYEVDLNLTGGRVVDESGEDLVWSAGVGIDVLDRLNLRLEYEEIDIEAQPQKRAEMIERSGRSTVPQIFIDDRHIGGSDDLYALDAAGGLDPLLRAG